MEQCNGVCVQMKAIDDKWIAEIKKVALDKAEALKQVAEADRRFIALMNQVMGMVSAEAKEPLVGLTASPTLSSNGDDGNTSAKILAVIRTEPDKRWRYSEIAARVPGSKVATVRSLLYRMESAQKVVKAGRGKYKAAPTTEQTQ
jgi:hypothetical protein